MQKRISGLIGIIIVLWSNLAEASIAFLPRYTGNINSRYNEANIGPGSCAACPTGYDAISGMVGATTQVQAC